VVERSRVRLPASALPGSLGQLSIPSLCLPVLVNKDFHKSTTSSLLAGIKAGRIHLCRVAAWQVTLCDPTW